jgi:hypothetical protein
MNMNSHPKVLNYPTLTWNQIAADAAINSSAKLRNGISFGEVWAGLQQLGRAI